MTSGLTRDPELIHQDNGNSNDSSSSGVHYVVVALYHKCEGFSDAVNATPCHEDLTVIVQSCDLTSSTDLDRFFEAPENSSFDICVHTAALSSPRACQQNPERAQLINVPREFFQRLASRKEPVPIVALSTDQVYDGTKDVPAAGPYVEGKDLPKPLNVYGQTKLDMEEYLQQIYPEGDKQEDSTTIHATSAGKRVALLRSSIILGPKAPFGGAHDTFLHFCQSRKLQETTFFTNEWRTVVGVHHVCRVLDWMIHNFGTMDLPQGEDAFCEVYHLGGPNRVNRYEMAETVFEVLGYGNNKANLLRVEQTSPTSPLDISMDSSKLRAITGIAHEPTTLKGLVELVFSDTRPDRRN